MYDLIRNLIRRPAPRELPTGHPVMRDEQDASFLWLDRPDARREIRRRQKAGEITTPEAKLLDYWAENGYVILERCVDPDLIDAACRLVRLLNRPETIGTLAPLIEREIAYRLLNGPHGPMLRHVATAGSHLNQVSRAIAAIRRRFDAPIRIEEVAAQAGMSPSSLHAHFKAITRMTPLEYQKQLRLQEARRLMLAGGATAGAASFAVGYESPSQFSREYRRLFGAPPRQDIERLQAAAAPAMAL